MDAEQTNAQADEAEGSGNESLGTKIVQTGVGCVVLLALLAGAGWLLRSCDVSSIFETSPEGAAIWEARKAAEARLTSPGSAKFKGTDVVAYTEDRQFHLVYVIVDSQNALGALVRTYFYVLTIDRGEMGTEITGIWNYESAPSLDETQRILRDEWPANDWVKVWEQEP